MSDKLARTLEGDVLRLRLNRPDVRNAMDEEMIGAITAALREGGADDEVRIIVLSGEGKAFCAGADIRYMHRLSGFDEAANLADAKALGDCFLAISDCPKPVVAVVHGAAIGGGVGLVAAADIVIAAEGTTFALTEVRLGILPAVISPFVLRRLGPAACRYLFLSGERFAARRAQELGLCDQVVPADQLDAATNTMLEQLRLGGPTAQTACKELLDEIGPLSLSEAARRTPKYIARQRSTAEAKEGFAAFFEKRKAAWARSEDEA